MLGCFRSCFGKTVTLIVLLGVAFAGWRWGPAFFPRVEGWLGISSGTSSTAPQPSEELADSAMARLGRLRDGEGDRTVSLSGLELTSVLRFGPASQLPTGVIEPRVEMEDGQIRLSGKVVLSAFPDLPDLGAIIGILPDTLPVTLRATLVPFGEEDAALVVHRLDAARIPLPGRLIPEILRALGRSEEVGLPPDALRIPLPEGLVAAYVLSDSLVLRSDR